MAILSFPSSKSPPSASLVNSDLEPHGEEDSGKQSSQVNQADTAQPSTTGNSMCKGHEKEMNSVCLRDRKVRLRLSKQRGGWREMVRKAGRA